MIFVRIPFKNDRTITVDLSKITGWYKEDNQLVVAVNGVAEEVDMPQADFEAHMLSLPAPMSRIQVQIYDFTRPVPSSLPSVPTE